MSRTGDKAKMREVAQELRDQGVKLKDIPAKLADLGFVNTHNRPYHMSCISRLLTEHKRREITSRISRKIATKTERSAAARNRNITVATPAVAAAAGALTGVTTVEDSSRGVLDATVSILNADGITAQKKVDIALLLLDTIN